jgi:hypothetical protein
MFASIDRKPPPEIGHRTGLPPGNRALPKQVGNPRVVGRFENLSLTAVLDDVLGEFAIGVSLLGAGSL